MAFTKTLSQPQGLSTLVPPVEKTSEEASNLGLVNDALKAGFQVQDTLTKGQLNEDLEEVNRQETVFQAESSSLRNQILSPNDQKDIDGVNDQLTRLERGHQAGKLTSAEASIRRNSIVKSAMNRNPWIASELRAAASIYGSAAGRGSTATQTPEEKALDAAREEAVKNQVPLSTILEAQNFTFESGLIKKKADLAASQGKLSFPAYRNVINRESGLAQAGVQSEMFQVIADDPRKLDEVDWLARIAQEKDTMKDKAIALEATYATHNAIFGSTERTAISKDIDDSFALLEEFAKSNDKVKFLEKKKKMVGLIGFENMLKSNKRYASLLAMGVAEDRAFDFAYDKMNKVIKSAIDHGGLKMLQEAAERGNTDAAHTLFVLQNEASLIADLTAQKLISGTPANNPLEVLLLTGASGEWLSFQATEAPTAAEKQTSKRSIENITSHLASYSDLQYFLKPSINATVDSDPKLVKKLDNRMGLREATLVADLNREVNKSAASGRQLAQTVDFDVNTDKFVVKATPGTATGEPGLTPTNMENLLKNLNIVYQVNKLYEFFDNQNQFVLDIIKNANTIVIKKEDKPTGSITAPEDVLDD